MPSWTLTFSPTGEPAQVFREDAPDAIAPPDLLAHIVDVFGPSSQLESRPARLTSAAAFIEWPPTDTHPGGHQSLKDGISA